MTDNGICDTCRQTDQMKKCSLVLLPGLDGTGKLFSPLIEALPEWIEPIVVSYPVDKSCGYRELGELVSAACPTDGDFVVLGESFSGPLAVMAAAGRPDGLRGIILCASFVRNPFRLLPASLSRLSVGPIYRLWPATIRLRALMAGDQYAGLVEEALAAIGSVRPDVIAARVRAILNVDVGQLLRETDVPLLYVAARNDYLVRKHNVEEIRQMKPDTVVTEIDTRHFVLQLEPGKSAAAIERFISRTLS